MASAVIVRASRCTITASSITRFDPRRRGHTVRPLRCPDDVAYATGTAFVADGGYLLAPVDATAGPPLHYAAFVILLAALRRTHLPASPTPGDLRKRPYPDVRGHREPARGAGLRALPRRILGRVLKP
jgi:hypothetical protein